MGYIFTTETRLSNKDASGIIEYAKQYAPDFGLIERYVWHYITSHQGIPDKAKLNTDIQNRFGVTKRTANSAIYDMSGRYRALKELKCTECSQYRQKISALQGKINKLALTVNTMKAKAASNQLPEKQLVTYRKLKKKLFYKKQRMQKYKDRLARLESDIAAGRYTLGFGGKKLFDAQYRLEENGFHSHQGWLNAYRSARDANIYYLGSKDETSGNQMFQLSANPDGTYRIQIRKDGQFVSGKDKYVTATCSFRYMNAEIRNSIKDHSRPVSYRLKIRGSKVYLQAIVQLDMSIRPIVTNMCDGAIGLDFNDGHIDMAETDRYGNLVNTTVYPLEYHGTGTKAVNEMRTVIAQIGRYALSVGKSIAKEDLSFIRKKARTNKSTRTTDKKYNKMIHTLDYSRFEDYVSNMAVRNGIDLVEVNPAYTSQIAKQKYAGTHKIPVHNAAAYVIARRGQGFKDKLILT